MPAGKPRIPAALAFLPVLAVTALAALLVHEAGHGLTAAALGGRFTGLYVWPGIQVWPHPGRVYPHPWEGWLGVATYQPGRTWVRGDWRFGLVALMGSGTNFLLAAAALALLRMLRPRGWTRRFLLAEAWMFLDLTCYTLCPLLGLRHFIVIGGAMPEPLVGALEMGIPAEVFVALVITLAAGMAWSAGRAFRTNEPISGG